MLEAENVVIRIQVAKEGILWPGVFKALGLLKEEEDLHLKPNRMPANHLTVPGDGVMHDSDSWTQWWKAPRKKIKEHLRFLTRGNQGRKGRRRGWTWKALGQKLLKQGKKDFVQALLAWGVVATMLSRAIVLKDVHTAWKWTAAIAWVSSRCLPSIRLLRSLLDRHTSLYSWRCVSTRLSQIGHLSAHQIMTVSRSMSRLS